MKGTVSGHVNLLKTMLGSGILSFPHLFSTYGVLPTGCLTFMCAFFSTIGLYILAVCSQKIGRNCNLSLLATECAPHMCIFIDIAVFIKCMGAAVSYLIIVRQLLPQILSRAVEGTHDSRILLLAFVLCFGPLSYFNKLSKLRYTSLCGLIGMLLTIVATVFRYQYMSTSPENKSRILMHYSVKWPQGLGKFVFAFTCHMNFFTVYNEMEDNTVTSMRVLIVRVVLIALVSYIVFGYLNSALYGDGVHDNVLENYPNDNLALIVKSAYVLIMAFSYPLQINPCRLYLMSALNIADKKKRTQQTCSMVITTLIIVATTYIACGEMKLGMVYTIVGSTSSTLLCLILPGIFYLNIDIEKNTLLMLFSYIAFLFGTLVFCISMLSMIAK